MFGDDGLQMMSVPNSSGDTAVNIERDTKDATDNVLRLKPKRQSKSSSKGDRKKRNITTEQLNSARKEKIYEQQCEIEELRRRIRDVCSDNKFLREQNYWQAKALEKVS